MFLKKIASSRNGQSLVELLLVIMLAALILPSLTTVLITSRSGRPQAQQRQRALSFLREAQEAVRVVREKGWNSFAVNGTYSPVVSGSSWTLATGSAVLNGFTQQVVITDTYRNSSGAIVTGGGTIDPSTKKVAITVSWTAPTSSSVSSILYLTRYLENIALVETTDTQFNAGTKNAVTVTNTLGGEVLLGAGGQRDWCEPNPVTATLDLPKNGVANAVSAIEGRVFAGTGENASGVSFANVAISDTHPPVPTIAGTYDCCKTNGIFGETNYAYLATDTNTKEITIIDLSHSPYTKSGYFNAPGNGNGNSIFVVGNVGYMTAANKLYTFDLTSKLGSRAQLGSITLTGTGNRLYVVGSYAYVAINSTSTQLQIVNVSNPSNLSIVGQATVDGQLGRDVFVNSTGTRAYLATSTSSTQKEFFILDVSTKTANRPTLGSYEANGMDPKGVTVVTGNKAILVGTSAEEYQVINIANESSPSRCGGFDVNTGIIGVSSVLEADGDAYSYIVTGDATSELKIIEGGPGGQYASSGDFTSSTFDPGVQTNFNRISATISKPSQTDIKLQVAVADAVSGSCNGVTFNFVGPDSTSNTFFTSLDNATIVGAIPIDDNGIGYENPSRCFRYKAFLSTSDSSQSPVFYDIAINYSP